MLRSGAPHSRYGSYLEFFTASRMARFPHTAREGGGFSIRLLKIDQDAHEDEDPAVAELLVGLVLGGTAATRWRWGGGGAWHRTKTRMPGEIGVSPIGASGVFQVDGPSKMLVVGIPLDSARQALGYEPPVDFGRLHDRYACVPAAMRLCLHLWRAAGWPSAVSDEVMRAAAAELIEALAADGESTKDTDPPKRLSLHEIARINEMISDLGPAHVEVSDLASGLDRSLKGFRRAFRHTFNKRPHAFLIERRIELGLLLLDQGDRPIAEIALELGFASQSHFTMAFSKQLGISPQRFQRFLRE